MNHPGPLSPADSACSRGDVLFYFANLEKETELIILTSRLRKKFVLGRGFVGKEGTSFLSRDKWNLIILP